MALVSVLLVMVLMGALLLGFLAVIAADQQASGVNRDQTQAYAAAHAGLEKLTADLGALFVGGNFNPSADEVNELTLDPPVLPGYEFVAPGNTAGYTITPGAVRVATIPNGPFQGLLGLITPYEINVTARADAAAPGGAEARMRRELQTVAVPVFQFGIYSDNDLSFYAGPDFDFGGRVHTNQNAYLAQDGTATLTLREVFTAVGEVIRTHLANGLSIATTGHRGNVRLALTGGSNPTFRNLTCGGLGGSCNSGAQEGSVNVATVPPSTLQTVNGEPTMVLTSGNTRNEPRWTNLSTGSYSNRLRNGVTGGRRLDLPLVSDGAAAVDLVRRPSVLVEDNPTILAQRYFSMASLRILLSDRASDITSLQTVTAAPPIDLARLAKDAAYRADPNGLGTAVTFLNGVPLAEAGTYSSTASNGREHRVPPGTPLSDGYLKIERQDRDGDWFDVTVEILNLGFTGRNIANAATWNSWGTTCSAAANDPSPNAVVRLQRVHDRPFSSTFRNCGRSSGGTWSTDPRDYLPLALYDAREGARRDDSAGTGTAPLLGGVMHYMELDVNNLREWLETHPDTMDVTGYVVHFSDRRGNKNLGPDNTIGARAGADGVLYTADDFADDRETGELGFEDIINPTSAMSVSNGTLDTGEDVNGNGVLDVYGGTPRLYPSASSAYRMATVPGWTPATGATGAWAAGASTTISTAVTTGEARVNPQMFFRRAIKLVNGHYTSGTLRLPANGTQGLTVASENPLYIQGNFNAPNAAGTGFGTVPGTDHVSASVIADAVTLLSNNFNDIRSFMSPHVAGSNREATTTYYRVAVISGKGLNFPRPTSNTGNDHMDFGTDGGAHNFLRYIEDWNGQSLHYRGSIVSLFLNRQAVGVYKCCNVVYEAPSRGYNFDTDFLTPALLPPRTPMFRDINTLTFRQLLRPNQ
jgi:hypothetical protein